MANLSNINGKFVVEQTTGFVGVGTTDPGFLIEAAGTNAELALNAGSIYRLRSTAGNEFIITKNGVGDFLTLASGGDATFLGNITFGDSHFIGNDGDDNLLIQSSAGENIVLDSADDIVLDADGADVVFKDAGTAIGRFKNTGGNFVIKSEGSDDDLIFKGNDGGSEITALTLDMSAGGEVQLNSYGSGTFTGTTAYSLAVDSSGNIIETTDGGPYLPLAGGTMTGQLTNTTGVSWGTNVKLINTNDDASPPILSFEKAPTSGYTAMADNDYVGFINFRAKNDNDQIHSWVELSTLAIDVSDGSESSAFRIGTWGAGTEYANTIMAKSGNVGIGIASPASKLDISGGRIGIRNNIVAASNLTYSTIYSTENTGAAYPFTGTSGNLVVEPRNGQDFVVLGTSGVAKMVVKGGGNVGIGNTAPPWPLTVGGNVGFKTTTADGSENRFYFQVGGAADPGIFYVYNGAEAVTTQIHGAGDSYFNGGNVGIGVTSPATKLQVANAGEVIVRSSMTAADGYRGGFEADNQHTGGTIWSMFSTNDSDGYFGGGKFVIANESMGGVDANTTGKFIIDGSGNVTIDNTVSGDAKLTLVTTTGGDPTIIMNSDAANRSGVIKYQDAGTNIGRIQYDHTSDRIDMQAGSATGATLSVLNEKVGIGTTSPSAGLDIAATSTNQIGAAIIKETSATAYLTTSFNSRPTMTLYGVNTANTYVGTRLSHAGNTEFFQGIVKGANNGEMEYVWQGYNGTAYQQFGYMDCYGTGAGSLIMSGDVVAYSDKKLKENIKTLDGSKVYKMRGVSFDRIDTGKKSSGVIAQEMQEVAPELVNESGDTLGVAYGNISGYLIEAIKELKAEIEELKKQIK